MATTSADFSANYKHKEKREKMGFTNDLQYLAVGETARDEKRINIPVFNSYGNPLLIPLVIVAAVFLAAVVSIFSCLKLLRYMVR